MFTLEVRNGSFLQEGNNWRKAAVYTYIWFYSLSTEIFYSKK